MANKNPTKNCVNCGYVKNGECKEKHIKIQATDTNLVCEDWKEKGKMTKDEEIKTEEEIKKKIEIDIKYGFFFQEILMLEKRIEKLEKCNRIAEIKEHIEEELEEKTKDMIKNMRPATQEEIDYVDNYMMKNSVKTGINIFNLDLDKTADEMFKELGYVRQISKYYDGGYFYNKRTKDSSGLECIESIIIPNCYCFCKYKSIGFKEYKSYITEAEDKAIHKKIEELKNEKV